MTDQHPITPPPELMQQWVTNAHDVDAPPGTCPNTRKIIVSAINWAYEQRGAVNEAELQKARDEELEACCEWVSQWCPVVGDSPPELGLRAARRPKPPSWKEQALEALDRMDQLPTAEDQHIIRRALEQLDD